MREIKFRGKATVPHEDMGWVYGSLVIGPVFNSIHFTTNKGPQSVLVDWIRIGQYTGLKDKNGVEIYEGDVLYDGKSDGVVIYRADFTRYVVASRLLTKGLATYMARGAEVIGNIFDNPEFKKRFWGVWNRENLNQ